MVDEPVPFFFPTVPRFFLLYLPRTTLARRLWPRVPRVYLGSAFLRFFSLLPSRRINNLRAFNAPSSSIPTAPTNHLPDGWRLSKFAQLIACQSGSLNAQWAPPRKKDCFQDFFSPFPWN